MSRMAGSIWSSTGAEEAPGDDWAWLRKSDEQGDPVDALPLSMREAYGKLTRQPMTSAQSEALVGTLAGGGPSPQEQALYQSDKPFNETLGMAQKISQSSASAGEALTGLIARRR